jgi:hypothetical protein
MANSIFVDPSGVVPNGVATGSVLVSNGVNAPPVFSATPTVTSLLLGTNPSTGGSLNFGYGAAVIQIRNAANTADVQVLGLGGSDQIEIGNAGSDTQTQGNFFPQAVVRLLSGNVLDWNGDVGLSRLGAASLALGNATSGDFSGSLKLTTLNAVGAYQFAGAAFVTATIGPSNPATTASTTLVMAGLAGSITTQTGRVEFTMSGTQSDGTVSDGSKVQISYGTGTAPVNGAALTGTQAGSIISFVVPGVTAATGGFSAAWIATGLTLNTAYWFDVAYASVTGGTTTISSVAMTARDIP